MWLGIDFGTCLSSAALMIDNNVRLVKDPDQSGFSIPSSVYVTESGEIRIGHAPKIYADKIPAFIDGNLSEIWEQQIHIY
jgi:molecular chaperone DnaK (HSP70)